MRALLQVIGIVGGVVLDTSDATVEPTLLSILHADVPAGTEVGEETLVVCKVRVHSLLPG